MTVPTKLDAAQPLVDDHDRPVPLSERYRKSFIATLSWSAFAILIAIGSWGQSNIALTLTEMSYPTAIIVPGSMLLAIYWFYQFLRSERLLNFASSEFAFGLTASSLAEALEAFKVRVELKTAEIGMMTAVKEPDFQEAKMALLENEVMLNDIATRLSSSLIHEWGGNVRHAINENNKQMRDENSSMLIKAISELQSFLGVERDKIFEKARRQRQLINIWDARFDAVHKAGTDALERVKIETKSITDAADKLHDISSQISQKDANDMRTLEYWPARICLAAAVFAGVINLCFGAFVSFGPVCDAGTHSSLCVLPEWQDRWAQR